MIGMSGYIFTCIIIVYYQPYHYNDILYCVGLNIFTYFISLMARMNISLFGHFGGIFIGFLFTREFFSFIFNSPFILVIEKILKKIFGKCSLFIEIPQESLNSQSHIEIMNTMKNDIINQFKKCKRSSSSNENELPI